MAITMYGIKNCDTIKKARSWLEDRAIAYDFHDYKSAGVDRATLKRWADKLGWEVLLNRDLSQAARCRARGDRRGEGDRAHGGPAVDDQTSGAGRGRRIAGRLQARHLSGKVLGPGP